VVEAMARGVPVVAAGLPPMNEIGGAALLAFDPDSPETFDARVLEAIQPEAARERAIAAGRERAAAFTWPHFAESLNEAFDRAVREPLG
ncbi:MAG: glycosyltransferase family 1 protein, partial [Erythrobacter sp.]